jgi:hypothetical protein
MQAVKICRECGEEFRPEILRCTDCGGELETRFEEDGTAWPSPQDREEIVPDPRPAGDYQPIAWSGHAAELTPLADRLVEAGIPFYLRPRASEAGQGAAGYEVRVRQEEREAALREMAALGPAAAGSPEGGKGPESCPACGHALTQGALECPDCGLAVGEPPE